MPLACFDIVINRWWLCWVTQSISHSVTKWKGWKGFISTFFSAYPITLSFCPMLEAFSAFTSLPLFPLNSFSRTFSQSVSLPCLAAHSPFNFFHSIRSAHFLFFFLLLFINQLLIHPPLNILISAKKAFQR
ncbi:unnamed protein product [Meloidogyne enterolobii]|uniref:Uncharacterized protein n=2 Tax=Meloidogyne enterolobii TaxID=390850 RepID=A0ACB1AS02_MELEN